MIRLLFRRTGIRKIAVIGIIITVFSMLIACGDGTNKVYGLWLSTSQYHGFTGKTIYYTVIEFSKDTYTSGLLGKPQEFPVTYEKHGDRVIVKDVASGKTLFILQNISGDSMTDIAGSPTVYKKVTQKDVEEIKAEIQQSSRGKNFYSY